MTRAGFDGAFKAQGISHARALPAGQQAHRTPPPRVTGAARQGPVMLRKAALHIAGNAAIQCAVCTFQQIDQPGIGCHARFTVLKPASAILH